MPNRITHATAGTATAAIAAAFAVDHAELTPNRRWTEVLGAAAGGWIGGLLPDVLEPATSPNHRQRAHALTTAGAIAVAARDCVPDSQAWCRQQADRLAARRAVALQGSQGAPPSIWWLGLAEFTTRAVGGFVLGLIVGYESHLLLDSFTPNRLPLV